MLMHAVHAIPYGRQSISENDIQAVVDVLRSDFLTQGPVVPAFEESVATYCHVRHGVAVNSATSALHIACLALGLSQGDWLWTSPITFVASANCGLYCGARVDFVDIDPRTFNLCPVALEKKLMQAQATGTLPKIVVAVHMCGQPCDMRAIHALSVQYGFKVIEDASHAIGAKYLGEPVGNCRFSDITVFSFHPVKIITTAEGGMAMTQDKQLAAKMRALRSHGISSGADEMVATPENEIWNYQQHSLGFNYRMTELQAALGLSQMDRLDSFVQTRHALAEKYNQAAWSDAIEKPWQHADAYSSFHLYIIKISPTQPHVTQRLVYEGLLAAGIRANLHYIPVYRQPFYAAMGFSKGYCPHAEAYFQQAISIPLYADLQQDDQNFVSRVMDKLTCAQRHDSDPVTEPTESGAL